MGREGLQQSSIMLEVGRNGIISHFAPFAANSQEAQAIPESNYAGGAFPVTGTKQNTNAKGIDIVVDYPDFVTTLKTLTVTVWSLTSGISLSAIATFATLTTTGTFNLQVYPGIDHDIVTDITQQRFSAAIPGQFQIGVNVGAGAGTSRFWLSYGLIQ